MMDRRQFLATAAAGATAATAVGTEKAEAGGPLLRFGVVADAQYADAEAQGERHYRATPEKLRAAVECLAAEKLAFTFHLGDLIDRDFRSFDALLPLLAGLGHPVHQLLGNHDYDVADADKPRVAAKLGMPADYYCFRNRGLRFVVTDTNAVSTYKHPRGTAECAAGEAMLRRLEQAGQLSAKPWNGGVDDRQLEWLEGELAAADVAGERAIVFGHHPLWPVDPHQAWNAEAVLAVLERHQSVAAWFNGHNHAGAYGLRKGIHHVTFRSLLHRPETTAWAVVGVFTDRIEIAGRGREESRVLKIR